MYPIKNELVPYVVKPYDNVWLLAQRYNTTIFAIAAINPGIDINYLPIGQVIHMMPGFRKDYSNSNVVDTVATGITEVEVGLINHLRMLWEEHVTWTRLAIISTVFDLPDAQLVTNRLLQNPKDFELAFQPFYGNDNASKFADLFTSHLVIASQLVSAAKVGDNNAAEDAEKRWYSNADEIAAFLASINPYWSQDDWKIMLYEHLKMTKAEAVDMITKDYQAGINEYDKIEEQALTMADVMASGIVKQFQHLFI
jgi:hypothetical protein